MLVGWYHGAKDTMVHSYCAYVKNARFWILFFSRYCLDVIIAKLLRKIFKFFVKTNAIWMPINSTHLYVKRSAKFFIQWLIGELILRSKLGWHYERNTEHIWNWLQAKKTKRCLYWQTSKASYLICGKCARFALKLQQSADHQVLDFAAIGNTYFICRLIRHGNANKN